MVGVRGHYEDDTKDHPHRDDQQGDEGVTADTIDLGVVHGGVGGEGGACSRTVCTSTCHIAVVRVLVRAVQHGSVVGGDTTGGEGGGGVVEVVLESEGGGAAFLRVPHEVQPLLPIAVCSTGATEVANHRNTWWEGRGEGRGGEGRGGGRRGGGQRITRQTLYFEHSHIQTNVLSVHVHPCFEQDKKVLLHKWLVHPSLWSNRVL